MDRRSFLVGTAATTLLSTACRASTVGRAPKLKTNNQEMVMDRDGQLFRAALDQLNIAEAIAVIKIHMYETFDNGGYYSVLDISNRWAKKYPWMVEELMKRSSLHNPDATPESKMYQLSRGADMDLLKRTCANAKLWYTLYMGKGDEA